MDDFPPDRFIDLLRHGEPEDGYCFRGQHDDLLSKLGQQQMANTVGKLTHWSNIISSPALRCQQFAQQLATTLNIPLTIEQNFREREFGDWEGKKSSEIDKSSLEKFWKSPSSFTPPNAETLEQFIARVQQQWLNTTSGSEPFPLLITHGGVIRAIVGDVLSIPPDKLILLETPYACLSRVRLPSAPGKPSLIFHNANQDFDT